MRKLHKRVYQAIQKRNIRTEHSVSKLRKSAITVLKKYPALVLVLTAIFLSNWNFACFANIWVLRNCHSPSAFGRITLGELVSKLVLWKMKNEQRISKLGTNKFRSSKKSLMWTKLQKNKMISEGAINLMHHSPNKI